MFRQESRSAITKENFGAGSIIIIDGDRLFLVIASSSKMVTIDNLQDFSTTGVSITVQDSNFLTEKEARKLVDALYHEYNMNHTFTDATLIPSGIKHCVDLIARKGSA